MNMREQPRTRRTRQEGMKSAEERYLRGLGTEWEKLEGKKVLDIGANTGAFADVAKQHGVEVVSFDIHRRDWNKFHRNVDEKTAFVQGDARALPFANESFDVTISHAGPFGSGNEEVFREAYRVLKQGGELRVGPTPILPDEPQRDLPEGPERMAVIRERSRAYVEKLAQEVGFSDFEYTEHPPAENGIVYCHFVLKK